MALCQVRLRSVVSGEQDARLPHNLLLVPKPACWLLALCQEKKLFRQPGC